MHWYDSECREKKKLFDFYENQFRTSGSDEDKISMCKIRNEYRKCYRIKRKKHDLQKAEELYEISKTNTADFWKRIKRTEYENGICDFFDYFKNLYSISHYSRNTGF